MYKILKEVLTENNIDAFLLPSNDEFFSEYSPPYYRRLEQVTGFTGSNGFAIITKTGLKNAFFTDGRYTIQAKQEVSNDFQILNYSMQDIVNWISDNLNEKNTISFDPKLHTLNFINNLKQKTNNIYNLKAIGNPVDEIWENRPTPPCSFPFLQPLNYAGKIVADKIVELVKFININKADYILITDPESVCWLLNIRGKDIPTTPVILCYCLVSKNGKITIFLNDITRFDNIIKDLGVETQLMEIDNLSSYMASNLTHSKLLLEKYSIAYWFEIILKKIPTIETIAATSPILLWKSCKNETEIAGFKHAHIEDAIAVIRSLAEIDEKITTGKELTELDVVKILFNNRSKSKDFICESFDTIAGFAEHGAIVHYRPTEKSNKTITKGNLLLIDSGGHYFSGTTDITRTIAIGNATDQQKLHYTMVLKGHIGLASCIFPDDICGEHLDVLARQHLWQINYDYSHGTGHGVGNCLNVHEGPCRISKNASGQQLLPGMIISDEPGIYLENQYGIRIENLICVEKHQSNFLKFNTLTLVPYDRDLIDFSMINGDYHKWLVEYYQNISNIVLPKLNGENAKIWLEKQLSLVI